MSPRRTPTTLNTKIHRRTSSPSRMIVRVSSLIAAPSPLPGAVDDGGAAHRDAVAVGQSLAADALAVDERAVGRAEVADAGHEVGAVVGHADLAVPPGDAGVVEDDVRRVVAAEDGDGAHERVALTVDVEPGPVGRVDTPRWGRGRHRGLRLGGLEAVVVDVAGGRRGRGDGRGDGLGGRRGGEAGVAGLVALAVVAPAVVTPPRHVSRAAGCRGAEPE